MRLPRLIIFGLLGILLFSLPGWPAANVRGATGAASTVMISPVATCCYDQYDALSFTFTVNVSLILAPGESINGFDIRINYTNAYTSQNHGVLQAESLNDAGGIFYPYRPSVVVNCIDDIPAQGTNGCPSDDSPLPGQIHLAEAIVGSSISYSGLLFSIAFKVTGYGRSLFVIDRANLVNPHGDPSDPNAVDPVYIPVIMQSGFFANSQSSNVVYPFFNFQSADTSVSPSIIPNHRVNFDASASSEKNNPSPGFWRYSWNFGGQPTNITVSVPTVSHTFSSPGNYTVVLGVWDGSNRTGTVSRTVSVLPALGTLDLLVKDVSANLIAGTVVVKLFNSSTSNPAFATQAINTLTGEVKFSHLAPSGNYYLTFSGDAVLNATKTESISPGWTTNDRVYLQLRPPPADYSGLIYVGSILGALGVVGAAIVYKKRSSPGPSRRSSRAPAGRVSRRP